ncbi:MAG TPA: NAD(P)-binding protein [Solirubrobacterales bacterium]|nr:NAD(P)-binding protein [Solirubrobacterales bacterium]
MSQAPRTSNPIPSEQSPPRTGAVLVLGEGGGLGAALLRRFEQSGSPAASALDMTDGQAAELLREGHWRAVAVVTRDDAHALRLTLLSAHVRPDLPLWVTMFDHTVSRELEHVASKVHVLSPSEIVAGDLAEGCLAEADAEILGRHRHGVRLVDDALRLLVASACGLFVALAIEMTISMLAFHHGVIDAFYFSTRVVATVAGPPGAASGSDWFKLISAANMVLAIALVAIFTAALVRRLSRRRLTTLLGPRAAPARHHVVLVGFGQVGFRLAQALKDRGAAVIAIERDVEAPSIRLAKAAGIPVAVGRGDDREVLQRVGIERCAAVAAVTSDDLVNVAVGLAAEDLRPDVPIVLRLGDGEVASETDSLLHLGRICDAHKLAAETLQRAIEAGA